MTKQYTNIREPGEFGDGVTVEVEGGMRIADRAVEAAAKAIANSIGHGMREKCYDHARAALAAAVPHLPQGVVRAELEGRDAERVSKILGTGVDGRVVVAAMEDGDYGDSPCWLWRDHETNVTGFGRWTKDSGQAPYIRADIAIKGILSALSPAPVGVMAGVSNAANDLLTSIDPETLNPEQFNAWSALAEALASHEPAPTDAQEQGGWYFSINYAPGGEGDWANLSTPKGEHVANIRVDHAIAITAGMNALAACQEEVERLRTANAALSADGRAARKTTAANISRAETAEARILELERGVTGGEGKLHVKLQEWRDEDHESSLRLHRDQVIELCEEHRSIQSSLTACQQEVERLRKALEEIASDDEHGDYEGVVQFARAVLGGQSNE